MNRIVTALFCAMLLVLLFSCAKKAEPTVETIAPEPSIPEELVSPDTGLSLGEQKPPQNQSEAPLTVQPPAQTTVPKPSPIYEGVFTDYSAYTPYAQYTRDEIYTRLSDNVIPRLKISNSYGELLPYIAIEFSAGNVIFDFGKYGFVTAEGMIVTDPVYYSIYQPRMQQEWPDLYDTEGRLGAPVYILVLPKSVEQMEYDEDFGNSDEGYDYYDEYYIGKMTVEEINARENKPPKKFNPRYAVCASDGSWISDQYYEIYECDLTMMLIRDEYANNADIIDYNGKILYNTRSLPFYKQLPPLSINRYGREFWVKGHFMFRLKDGSVAFVEQLTGKYTIVDYSGANEFADSLPEIPQNDPPVPEPFFRYDRKVFTNNGELLLDPEGDMYYMPRQNVFVVIEKNSSNRELDYKFFSIYNMDGQCVFRTALDRWRGD